MKTRLLGAAVLIALAIIFIPMFFGSSHKQANDQSVSLDVPAQPDNQLQTRTLNVGPDSASVNAGANDPDHVATIDADTAKPLQSTSDFAVAPSQLAPPAAGFAPAPVTAPPKPAAAGSTPLRTIVKTIPTPTPTPPRVPVSTAPGAAAIGAYSLNLGIYTERANADRLVAKAAALKFPAHGVNMTYNGKAATRVVVGPFADRVAAEAARLKLKSMQLGVPVALTAVSADQKSDAPATAVPANRPGGWAVQLGAFGSESDANMMRDQLRALGFDGYVDDIPSGNGKLWRVRAGPVNERAAAEQLRTQIAAKMQIRGLIVTQS